MRWPWGWSVRGGEGIPCRCRSQTIPYWADFSGKSIHLLQKTMDETAEVWESLGHLSWVEVTVIPLMSRLIAWLNFLTMISRRGRTWPTIGYLASNFLTHSSSVWRAVGSRSSRCALHSSRATRMSTRSWAHFRSEETWYRPSVSPYKSDIKHSPVCLLPADPWKIRNSKVSCSAQKHHCKSEATRHVLWRMICRIGSKLQHPPLRILWKRVEAM